MKRVLLNLAACLFLAAIPSASSGAGVSSQNEAGAQDRQGTVVTLWPFFDYRESPATGFSNLAILGPLFKRERSGNSVKTAVRPLFFASSEDDREDTDILYPLASVNRAGSDSGFQILRLVQRNVNREGTAEERRDAMFFPFYISGQSEKYGPYTSVFPVWGDIYERFWRDEYHFALFPLYGRTVKKGTTTTNYLYPFFSTIEGEGEQGFNVWPLYGQAAREGVYEKSFLLWPFYLRESLGKDGDNPTENLYILPFYASSRSPQRSSLYTPWPFFGTVRNGNGEVIERDYVWPFWLTATGKYSTTERYLPFFAETRGKESRSRWIMWPLYHEEAIESEIFRQEKISLLYFLFSRSDESWPTAGRERSRSALWPLFAWKRDEYGVATLTIPAPVEPVVWQDGVERNWAPLWRLFISKRAANGDLALSILWSLYWQESRRDAVAWELSPLLSYRSEARDTEFRLLKGLFGFSRMGDESSLTVFWMRFGI